MSQYYSLHEIEHTLQNQVMPLVVALTFQCSLAGVEQMYQVIPGTGGRKRCAFSRFALWGNVLPSVNASSDGCWSCSAGLVYRIPYLPVGLVSGERGELCDHHLSASSAFTSDLTAALSDFLVWEGFSADLPGWSQLSSRHMVHQHQPLSLV